MNKEQKQQIIREEVINLTVASHRFDALKRMFEAACLEGDTVKVDALRLELQVCLDRLLDIIATQMMLTRQVLSE